ncbi:MAG TPA: DUF697 domain-containing protein [Xanthobacteraceae bacterium]|nr:DUF697 domain-containing protein [Xanthobacteraceae bacterium]
MKRKPLPKAITRSIANLQDIAAGFAADEQGRVPRQPTTRQTTPRQTTPFDAVEPEPRLETPTAIPAEIPAATGEPIARTANRTASEPQPRAADPLAARRRALARRIVERHKNYAAVGGLVPLPAANIASVTALNLRMVKQLTELYGVPFQRDRTRSLIIALIAGAVPTGAGLAASSTLMWIVPGGLLWGLGVSAITAGALTRGIGLVFIDSFEAAMVEAGV